jgi:hypothetical protein
MLAFGPGLTLYAALLDLRSGAVSAGDPLPDEVGRGGY